MSILCSEWTKLSSVRTTWLLVASAVLASVLLGLLGVFDLIGAQPTDLPDDWDPTAESLKGLLFAQLLVGMLGALSITSEFDTGMIATSLSIVPSRPRLLIAKAAVVSAIGLGTGIATVLISFTAVQMMLGDAGIPIASISGPGVARALVGAVIYLALIAVVGLSVGILARSTAGSLAALVGITLLTPAIAPSIPGPIGDWFARYWPITAGQKAYAVIQLANEVTPWLGLGILAAATFALGIASILAFVLLDA